MNSRLGSLALLVVSAAVSTESTRAQTTEHVSVSTGGAQANYGSQGAMVSVDGRFVVFESFGSNLVAGDTNGDWDIFVRDRVTGTTERVSVSTSGVEGNAWSYAASISADGRFVVFESVSSNLVAGDTNANFDVFLRDRQAGTTSLVSVTPTGTFGSNNSRQASITPDGRFVVFESLAPNLVAGDTNGTRDVFVRDLAGGVTQRISVSTGGAQGNDKSVRAAISADGRFVAFQSSASNLVAGDTNGFDDVFVHDRADGTTELVSVDAGGLQGNGDSDHVSLSDDGRVVAFFSEASNLVAGDTNGLSDVFVRNRQSGSTERVSISTSGAQGNGYGFSATSISSDGRYVIFESFATNLVANDTNGGYDVFMRDRAHGTTERINLDSSGAQADGNSLMATISANGRFVAFMSNALSLVPGDTNGSWDVFLRDRGVSPPTSYCTSSTSSHGCSASIAASANPSVSFANACNITVTNVEGLKSGLVFYGIDNAGFSPTTWGTGGTSLLCVKPPTQRTPIQNSGGTINACDGSFVLDWNAYQSAHPLALGNPWSIGVDVLAQSWFRDPAAVKSTNLSNAIELTYIP